VIEIEKSPTADSRTCDVTQVSKDQLIASTFMHKEDVRKGLEFFAQALQARIKSHDWSKLEYIDQFYSNFITKFHQHDWWDLHKEYERHHLDDSCLDNEFNLVDIIEHIVDCVMAGMARSGSVYEIKISNEKLQNAFKNTVEMLKGEILVKE